MEQEIKHFYIELEGLSEDGNDWIEVAADSSVENIKAKVYEKTGIEIHTQRLLFEGDVLEDEKWSKIIEEAEEKQTCRLSNRLVVRQASCQAASQPPSQLIS